MKKKIGLPSGPWCFGQQPTISRRRSVGVAVVHWRVVKPPAAYLKYSQDTADTKNLFFSRDGLGKWHCTDSILASGSFQGCHRGEQDPGGRVQPAGDRGAVPTRSSLRFMESICSARAARSWRLIFRTVVRKRRNLCASVRLSVCLLPADECECLLYRGEEKGVVAFLTATVKLDEGLAVG